MRYAKPSLPMPPQAVILCFLVNDFSRQKAAGTGQDVPI